MGVSQQSIAEKLNLSRTTVTKILNRDPKYSASETTRDLVFSTAEKMGYDFTTIRRPFKREYGRTEVNVKCDIEVCTDGDSVFDRGEATARNISVGGALLTELKLAKNCLPLSRFTIRCRFAELPVLANLVGECQVVRLTDSQDKITPELGVKFINANVNDRKILKDFIDNQVAESNNKRINAMNLRDAATATAAAMARAPGPVLV